MSLDALAFAPPEPDDKAEALRGEVRAFLAEALRDYPPERRVDPWLRFDPDFSAEIGRRGWIGMTWPKEYGGHERSQHERYVVVEEMLAAGAPVGAHWIGDRQSGPLILRVGTREQKDTILPRLARGEAFFCIGMSEPDSGSDLASVRTRAVRADGGFVVNGTKIWTSHAHRCDYMVLFARTGEAGGENRHGGMSQFLVDLATPGIAMNPIRNLVGENDFNEVVFEDVFLPDSALLGAEGDGWAQVTSELAFERSGPERFLSAFALLVEMARRLEAEPSEAGRAALGRIAAHIFTLRRLSRSVAGMLQAGENPALPAALVKDLGAVLEQDIPEIARLVAPAEPSLDETGYAATLARTELYAPSFSLRGGTREILRGIIARGLGLR